MTEAWPPEWEAVDKDGNTVGIWIEWGPYTPDKIRECRDKYHPGTRLRVTTTTATTRWVDWPPVEEGVWRHDTDGSECRSYPDSMHWIYVNDEMNANHPLWCNAHGLLMRCHRRENGATA